MAYKFVPQQHVSPLQRALAEAAKAKAEAAANALTETPKPIVKESTAPTEYVDAALCPDKIRIIFDDSGSMGGDRIKDAREGCIEFLRNCIPNQVAVAVHVLNPIYNFRSSSAERETLTSNLPALAALIKEIPASGSTPLFSVWSTALAKKPQATRYIIFSDGSPDQFDRDKEEEVVATAVKKHIPCDTVFITSSYDEAESQPGYALLKRIAEATGGYFMVFDKNKMDFKHGFKYLAPGLRLQLASASFRSALEEGKV